MFVVFDFAAYIPRIDDGEDGRIRRAAIGGGGLPGAAAAGIQHHLPRPCTNGIERDDVAAAWRSIQIKRLDNQHFQAIYPFAFGAGNHRANDSGEKHQPSLCMADWPSSVRPSGMTASTLTCGRGMTCTATTSPTFSALRTPASTAAFTAATSPRTIAVTYPPPVFS